MRIAGERIEYWQIERERLSRGSAGRDDHVLATATGVPRLELMCVEPRDTDRPPDTVVEIVGERHELRRAFGLRSEVRELFSLEQPFPAQNVDAHSVLRG